MSADMDKVKERVRKLFNLAGDDAAFDGEVDNALRAARALMLKYQLSEADLAQPRDPEATARDEKYGRRDGLTYGEKLTAWETQLAWAVVKLVGTVGHYITNDQVVSRTKHGTVEMTRYNTPRVRTRVVFYGPEEDARDAAELFEEWSAVIATTARLKHGGFFRGDGRAYAEGFAYALRRKVNEVLEAEQQLLAKPTGKELVLRSQLDLVAAKRKAAGAWLKAEAGVRLKNVGSRALSTGHSAFHEGVEDGKQSDFKRDRAKRLEGGR